MQTSDWSPPSPPPTHMVWSLGNSRDVIQVVGGTVTLSWSDRERSSSPHFVKCGLKVRLEDGRVTGPFVHSGIRWIPHTYILPSLCSGYCIMMVLMINYPRFWLIFAALARCGSCVSGLGEGNSFYSPSVITFLQIKGPEKQKFIFRMVISSKISTECWLFFFHFFSFQSFIRS